VLRKRAPAASSSPRLPFLSPISATVVEGETINISLSFVHYGARHKSPPVAGDSLSGAYLFLPDGPAKPVPSDRNSFLLVRGPLRQYLLLASK
jgi:hypothetical protein